MANVWTNFYPTLWSDTAYFELVKNTIATQVTNLTWVDPGGPSEAVRIPKFQYDEAAISGIDDLVDNPSNVSEATFVLNLDRNQGFFFQIRYSEQDKASVALGESVLRQRTAALASVIDADVLAQVSGFTNVLSGSCNKATLVSAIEILNGNNVPQTERVLVVSPSCYSDLLNTNDFVRADSVAGATANRTGFVGMVLGLEVFLSNNLPGGSVADAVVMHRAGVAMAMLRTVDVRVFDQPRHFATGYSGRAIWGRTLVDDNVGVRIDR